MRYDKETTAYIYKKQRKYNPKIGRHEEYINKEHKYYANITNSLERNIELFGQVDSDILTIRIQGKIQDIPSFFMIDDKKYSLIKKVQYKNNTTFYVREEK